MQLAQPIQGAHPRDSGRSALDYLLEGHAVVPPERGIFLSKTWRMHPDLCSFCVRRRLRRQAPFGSGMRDSATRARAGSASGAEARRVLVLPGRARGLPPEIRGGGTRRRANSCEPARRSASSIGGARERAMALDDVLVVAPYNMQVNLLRSRLPGRARGSARWTGSKARRRRR